MTSMFNLLAGEDQGEFEIHDLNSANWAFRKITAYKMKINDVEVLANAEIARITAWKDKETETLKNSIDFFESKLTAYAVTQRQADPKFKCSTPYGKITFRKLQPKWGYEEDTVLEALKRMKLNNFIRIKEEINKVELKNNVKVVNGMVVTSDGEIIDGISVEDQGEKIDVKIAD